MKNENTTLVVVKGKLAFTFENNTCERQVLGHPVDMRELKKIYPNALLRAYNDTRLSARLRSMVDKQEHK